MNTIQFEPLTLDITLLAQPAPFPDIPDPISFIQAGPNPDLTFLHDFGGLIRENALQEKEISNKYKTKSDYIIQTKEKLENFIEDYSEKNNQRKVNYYVYRYDAHIQNYFKKVYPNPGYGYYDNEPLHSYFERVLYLHDLHFRRYLFLRTIFKRIQVLLAFYSNFKD